MSQETNFKRGMSELYDLLKSGKAMTRAAIKSAMKKKGIKDGIYSRIVRLGRIGRKNKLFDIVISYGDGEKSETAKVQMVKGSAAKKVMAEKAERYANLGGSHKSKKSTKKTTKKSKSSHKHAPAKSAKTSKKTAKKTAKPKAVKAAATASSEESSAPSES